MNRKLGEVGEDSAKIPSSAFFVEHAPAAEGAAGLVASHRSHAEMTGVLAGLSDSDTALTVTASGALKKRTILIGRAHLRRMLL